MADVGYDYALPGCVCAADNRQLRQYRADAAARKLALDFRVRGCADGRPQLCVPVTGSRGTFQVSKTLWAQHQQ